MCLADTTGPAERANPDVSGGVGHGEIDDRCVLCVSRDDWYDDFTKKNPMQGRIRYIGVIICFAQRFWRTPSPY